jgi:multidrug efflux pump subunit AcrA (membrane-fusion protein)
MAVVNAGDTTIEAVENWWGSNTGPSGITSGPVDAAPFLVLGVTATPPDISPADSAIIVADLTRNSAGIDTAAHDVLPNGTPVRFSISGDTGSLSCSAGRMVLGKNATRFTPWGTGTSTIAATVDNQTVTIPVRVRGSLPVAVTTLPGQPNATIPTEIPPAALYPPTTAVPSGILPVWAILPVVFAIAAWGAAGRRGQR